MRKGTCYPGRLTGFIKMARDQTQASIMEGKEDGGDALQPGEGTRTGDGRPRKGGVRRCGRPASVSLDLLVLCNISSEYGLEGSVSSWEAPPTGF